MTAKIEGSELVIRIPLEATPYPSQTGKTRIVATTHGGVKTAVQVEGKPVTVAVNAYILPKEE